MTKEELMAKGANDSLTHVDFMVGSAELDIISETKSGERVQIFKAGEWSI